MSGAKDKAGAQPRRARAPKPRPATLVGDDWEDVLVKDGNGLVKGILANVVAILQHSPAWAGCVAFDDSRGEPVMLHPAPFVDHDDARGPWAMRPWTSADDTATAVWLQRVWLLRVSPSTVAEAVGYLGSVHVVNPVTAYLGSLRWDGTARLERWLVTYAGAPDTAYVRGVGATWLRAAVARAFEPGCKFDAALVFEGLQGKGKSTLLSILGGDHFTDDVTDLHSKDAAAQVRRAWIVELPEMAAATRSEVDMQKAFVARQVDRVRGAYERRVAPGARRCVFAGTTNADAYLKDPTGNRRWWPVPCTTIDLEALRRDRDQLWAEAVAGYKGGAGWQLDPALYGAATAAQEARHLADAWEDVIAAWLVEQPYTSIGEVLSQAIGIEKKEHWDQRSQNRVAAILQRLGWTRRQVRLGKSREWRYMPPAEPEPGPDPTPPVSPVGGVSPVGVTSSGDRSESRKADVSPVSPVEGGPANSGISEHGASSVHPLSNTTGDTGDSGDNSQNLGSESVTTPRHQSEDTGDTTELGRWLNQEHTWRLYLEGQGHDPATAAALAAQETAAQMGPRPAAEEAAHAP